VTESTRVEKLNLEKTEKLWEETISRIPSGTQTFSKAPFQHVNGVSPKMLIRGKGARVWDADGNEFIDYMLGLGPVILGHAVTEVNAAVSEAMEMGISMSLPHPMEAELARLLSEIIPCAEMARFGKNGSDATAGAVRAARGITGRDKIACCGYHG
jgi:glutamate-1-semialdehyde aminotransferase